MSHLIKIYTVCPLVFEFSIWHSLDLKFFENLQTKILSFAFRYLKELTCVDHLPLSKVFFSQCILKG